MGYRDRQEGLEERVRELESRLARSRETIARLRGEAAPPPEAIGPRTVAGVPSQLRCRRSFAGELPRATLLAVARLADARYPAARLQILQDSLSQRAEGFAFSVRPDGGRIWLEASTDHVKARRGLVFGGLATGTMAVPFAGVMAATLGAGALATGLALGLSFAGGVGATRSLAGRNLRDEQRRVLGLFETASDLIEEVLGPPFTSPPGGP
ncbi:MAG: hypothetical protein AAGA56_07630 [Myxococcota bacterium]